VLDIFIVTMAEFHAPLGQAGIEVDADVGVRATEKIALDSCPITELFSP
jgi:hypothetical protein